MALYIAIKRAIILLCFCGLLHLSALAQTSRVLSVPKQYTLNLAALNKQSFKKERLGSAARKMARSKYLDSVRAVKKHIKKIKQKQDSLNKVIKKINEQPIDFLTNTKLPSQPDLLTDMELTQQYKMLTALAKGQSFAEYLKSTNRYV